MGIFKKKQDEDKDYKRIVALSRIGAPTLKVVYYLAIVAAVLAGIVAFIMLFVNVPPTEMMLPPFMSLHGEEYYSLTVGSGIRIDVPFSAVDTGHIKTVIYAEIMLFVAVCIVTAPVSLFLSGFLRNIAKGDAYNPKNKRYMMFMGISVFAGGILLGIVRSVYNYMLISNFTAAGNVVHLSVGVDLGGIIIGLMIILFSFFWKTNAEDMTALPEKTEDGQ